MFDLKGDKLKKKTYHLSMFKHLMEWMKCVSINKKRKYVYMYLLKHLNWEFKHSFKLNWFGHVLVCMTISVQPSHPIRQWLEKSPCIKHNGCTYLFARLSWYGHLWNRDCAYLLNYDNVGTFLLTVMCVPSLRQMHITQRGLIIFSH